jgi:hypothetical protein
MYVGLGIFLLVVGAILSFAVRDRVDAVDLTMIGYIMMGGGALALLMSILMGNRGMPGSGYSSRTTTHVDPNTGTRVDETRVDGL